MLVQSLSLEGDTLLLIVADLKTDDAAHPVYIPLACLPERKALYHIPPCADGHATCTCAQCDCCVTALQYLLVEHLVRLQPAQAAKLPKPYTQVLGVADALAAAQAKPVAPTALKRLPLLEGL